MWNYQDCVDAFANRRRGLDYKKVANNTYMRHESGDDYSMFIFKMYHTDIVKIRMDLNTNRYVHTLHAGGWVGSSTTRQRVYDFSGVHIFGHPNSPVWRPKEGTRVCWSTKREFKVGDKIVAVHGYPFTDGMAFNRGDPIGEFKQEEFMVLEPNAELERKRLLRPWLEGIKVAIGLTHGTSPKYDAEDRNYLSEVLYRINAREPFDMAPVLGMVHHEWSRRGAQEEGDDIGKAVYKMVTDSLFKETRRQVPEIMVTGYLLDARK
jgi:hypothetical protein